MTEPTQTRTIAVHEAVLDKNRAIAGRNRDRFDASGCLAVNVLSSPGSGKTSLLERTLTDMAGSLRIGVIVGDLATDNDARRLENRGASIVQVNTVDICHLDAAMVERAVAALPEPLPQLLFIENVGNMVCPAAFDLGEHTRVVLLSVAEGEDKPLKYPTLFRTADCVVITKMDFAEPVGFERDTALRNVRAVAQNAAILETSARTGAGLDGWYEWLRDQMTSGAAPSAAD